MTLDSTLAMTVGAGENPMPTRLKVLTGASAILCVAHTAPDGTIHGHTYEVTAWWTGRPCAVESQQALSKWLSKFDHQRLPLRMSRAEDIAEQCLMALGCVAVDVLRPLERLFARVELP